MTEMKVFFSCFFLLVVVVASHTIQMRKRLHAYVIFTNRNCAFFMYKHDEDDDDDDRKKTPAGMHFHIRRL